MMGWPRRTLLLLVLLLVWPVVAAGAIRYASNSSSNTSCSAGTNRTTPLSVSAGLGCTQPGDTLRLLAGTYSGCGNCLVPSSGGSDESTRKTIEGDPQDPPRSVTINGTIVITGRGVNEKAYITYRNFRLNASGENYGFKVDGTDPGSPYNPRIAFDNIAHHITIDNVEIFGSDSHGIQLPGNQFMQDSSYPKAKGGNKVLNSTIYYAGTDSSLQHGLYACSDDLVFDNNSIHDVCGCGVHIYCSDHGFAGVINNVVSNSLAYNLNRSTGGNPRGDGVTCNNTQSYSCATGFLINAGGSTGAKMFNNRAHDTSTAFRMEVSDGIVYQNTGMNNGQCFGGLSGADVRNNICQSSGSCAGINCFSGSAGLDSDLKLTSATTPAGVHNGPNLTSLSIPGLTADFEGTPRPASGGWDLGADQFGGGSGPTCPDTCTCTITAGVCDPTPSNSPLAWWKFEEGVGTTASDSSGNNHTGTLQGAATWAPGRIGSSAVQLDGSSGTAVTVASDVLTNFAADQTVCMWAQTPSPSALGTGGLKQTLLNFSPSSGNGIRSVLHELTTPPGTWYVVVMNSGGRTMLGTQAQVFQANTWVHLCWTLASSVLTLYVNGVSVTTVAGDSFDPAVGNVIGGQTASGGNWSGKVDEVKMWNRALTGAEITTEAGGAVTTVAPRHRMVVR